MAQLFMLVFMLVFMLLIGIVAVDAGTNSGTSECIKIDACSCKLDNGDTISLHNLVSGSATPRFSESGTSAFDQDTYDFYYNPCSDFTIQSVNQACEDVALCQKSRTLDSAANLGTASDAQFEYRNGSVFVVYEDIKTKNGFIRSTEIELICDKTTYGRLEFIVEYSRFYYKFRLFSLCACPGKCQNYISDCMNTDACTCEDPRGNIIFNLHSLDNPTSPMQYQISPTSVLNYNPCSAVADPDCAGQSVCLTASNSSDVYYFGPAYTGTFAANGGQYSLHYSLEGGLVRSIINLKCDPDNEWVFKVNLIDYYVLNATLYSKCACNGGCNGSRPLQCILANDGCSCTVKESGKTYDFHKLNKKHFPMKFTDHNNYTYYYRPCSGLEYDVTGCQGAACQLSPSLNSTPLSLGAVHPDSASVSSSTGDLVIHYIGGDEGRSFDVVIDCDDKVTSDPVFTTNGVMTLQGHLHYKFVLKTAEGCP